MNMQVASEFQEQSTLIEWWRLECRYYGCDERLLFAIPNGRQRTKIDGHRLKQEGVRAGVPDLALAVARKGYHALYIEMKRHGGQVSKEQKEYHELLRLQGYKVCVCYGFDQAKKAIEDYLC